MVGVKRVLRSVRAKVSSFIAAEGNGNGRPKTARDERARLARSKADFIENVLKLPVLFTDRFGLKYILYPTDTVYDRFYHDGYNEVAEMDFCNDYVKPGMTAFDVGANYGIYTLMLARLAGAANVHAFEPERWNFYRLRCNLTINEVGPLHAHNWAVAHESGQVRLNVFGPEDHGWHSLGRPCLDLGDRIAKPRETRTVEAVALDDYCRAREIERIDFLKVDVEGAELEVFQGASRLFEQQRIGAVLFEIAKPMLEGMGCSTEDVFAFLRGQGFGIFAFKPRGKLQAVAGVPEVFQQNYLALPES